MSDPSSEPWVPGLNRAKTVVPGTQDDRPFGFRQDRHRRDLILVLTIGLATVLLSGLLAATGTVDTVLLEPLAFGFAAIVLGFAAIGLLGFWYAIRRWADHKAQAHHFQRMQDTLVQAHAEMTRANNAKTVFLAKTSHELRTPLNAVIGFSEALLTGIYGPLSDRQTATVKSIHESGLHLLNLVGDILDISRIEAGHVDLNPAATDLDELVRQSIDTVRPDAQQAGTSIRYESDGAGFEVDIDRLRTRQIVINLLTNAIRYGGSDQPISVRVDTASLPGMVVVAVVDHGDGMSPDQVAKATKPFIAYAAKGQRDAGSVGLGLAIAAGLAELQGGRLELTSQVGHGTTARLVLPQARATGTGHRDRLLKAPPA